MNTSPQVQQSPPSDEPAAAEGSSLAGYMKMVRSTLEYVLNIRSKQVSVEKETRDIQSQADGLRKDISVYDAILGPIPPSALKRKPRPKYMLLTEEERVIAEAALSGRDGGSGTKVVASRNNIDITGEKLMCLRDREWLNDEVINFYFDMLNECSSKCYLWNSFFWLKLSDDGKGFNYKSVQRWTTRKKIDLFAYERFVVPMNIGKNHWALGVVDLREYTVRYFDSLAGNTMHAKFAEWIVDYVECEFKDKRKNEVCPDFKSLFTFPLVDPPQQSNGFDCGVFTCMNAECLASGRDWIDFDQSLIPAMRRKITAQILKGRIK